LLRRVAGAIGTNDLPIAIRACYGASNDDFRTIGAQTGGNRDDFAVDPHLGNVRRKHGAGHRGMAYSCSGAILSSHGNSLDYPLETIAQVDRDRILPGWLQRLKQLAKVY
jgi:hypothetical protein